MEKNNNPVAIVKLTSEAETRDIESLETIINGRWHYEAETDIGTGQIEVYRTHEHLRVDE